MIAFRRAGIRSAQTTPLRSRDGRLLGMICTHWSTPHQPSERDLRLLDILARQAADAPSPTKRCAPPSPPSACWPSPVGKPWNRAPPTSTP
nr:MULTISPECIES: GAF domain-containing protein [unclassified Pseudomonas]